MMISIVTLLSCTTVSWFVQGTCSLLEIIIGDDWWIRGDDRYRIIQECFFMPASFLCHVTISPVPLHRAISLKPFITFSCSSRAYQVSIWRSFSCVDDTMSMWQQHNKWWCGDETCKKIVLIFFVKNACPFDTLPWSCLTEWNAWNAMNAMLVHNENIKSYRMIVRSISRFTISFWSHHNFVGS